MRIVFGLVASCLFAGCASLSPTASADGAPLPPEPAGAVQVPDVGDAPDWVIAIHGGAGVRGREAMTAELEAAYRDALSDALIAGGRVLERGGDGPEAIEAALRVLEDSPLFNAGRGAALDETGAARHDASIMRGDTRDAGAIAGSSRIRNPIAAARAVMERTENVMLHGDGADWFAAQEDLALEGPLYFETDARRRSLLDKRAREPGVVAAAPLQAGWTFGTVGAVVRDRNGVISAGTSTGGRTNKRYGRVGDSPVIGAGTYASNASCAVSATGHGEYFMRWTVARDVCARMEFAGASLEEAARAVVVDTLGAVGGDGAVIAVEPGGTIVFAMNGNGMYRGVYSAQTPPRTGIYADEGVR